MAGAAQPRDVHPSGPQPGAKELVAGRAPQIEAQPLPPEEPPGRFRMVGEPLDQLATDLVAAGTDAGADGRHEIVGLRPVGVLEGRHRRQHHAGGGAAPAAVDRRHRTRPRIGQQHRHAVGDPHGKANGRVVADENVAFELLVGQVRRQRPCDSDDPGAVHLAQPYEPPVDQADGGVHLAPGGVGLGGRAAKRERARGEQMRRPSEERSAPERRPPGFIGPDELTTRVW